MEIFTIGFAKKSAEEFFGLLQRHGIKRLLDVRLNNVSQLAGFTKRDDLRYFLRAVGGIEYRHEPRLAPTQDLLDAYKKEQGAWDDFQRRFLELMSARRIKTELDRSLFDVPTVLLCSEPTAENCHRRLVVDYLQRHWNDVHARHL